MIIISAVYLHTKP